MREIKPEVRLVSVTAERGIIFPPAYLYRLVRVDNGLRADPACETCAARCSRARPPHAPGNACSGRVPSATPSNHRPIVRKKISNFENSNASFGSIIHSFRCRESENLRHVRAG